MSFHAMVQGVIATIPKEGCGASGKRWISVGVRCKVDNPRDGEPDAIIAQVLAFSALVDTVSDLVVGDPVSVTGACKVNLFERNGAPCAGLGIVADQILQLKPRQKTTKRYSRRSTITQQKLYADFKRSSANDFDDDEITF